MNKLNNKMIFLGGFEMEQFNIYKDISERTKGDIYLGVVGPVRTGKSTFIKKFMDLMVIPNIADEYTKERTKDELPQSGTGRTIMTTEPKFVPNEAVNISVDNDLSFNVRLIDCVGYLVDGAIGHNDDDGIPRMINTPWSEDRLPFGVAAEIGTKKVIEEHSTIGVVITTDGTISDIHRDSYVDAEEKVISELKAIKKPFVVIINTTQPFAQSTIELKEELSQKHNVPVLPMNCAQMKQEDINCILEKILYEFPIQKVCFNFPKWIESLDNEHWLKSSVIKCVRELIDSIDKLVQIRDCIYLIDNGEYVKKAYIEQINLGNGCAYIEINVLDNLFFNVLSETTEMDINNEYELISTIKLLSSAKKDYDKVKTALFEVEQKGYGIVTPLLSEMELSKPELVKHGAKYGVKIKAKAPSIHLIKAEIETEVSPIVGTEQQSLDLIEYVNNEMENNDGKIWELNMFGKTMHELVKEGIQNKLYCLPEEAQQELQGSLQKIINDGNGKLICIML